MTAAVLYGKEDLKIEKVPIPRVGDGEVLVKVQVALTCGTDLKVYQRGYHARMIVPPALFGHELAGVIEEVGANVNGFKKGMRVVALNSAPCQMCFYCSKHQENLCEDLLFNNGAYAEYIRVPRRIVEANMLVIPSNVTFEDAAMTEPLACVLRGLHETGVEIGDTVTILGGGPIGLMFVQVARAIGCNVISVVKRDGQVEAAKHMGAHEIIQRTQGPHGHVLRWLRQWHQSATRDQSPALFRDHAEGDLPPHAGNGSPRIRIDCGKKDSPHRLHYGRGAAVAPAAGSTAHAEP